MSYISVAFRSTLVHSVYFGPFSIFGPFSPFIPLVSNLDYSVQFGLLSPFISLKSISVQFGLFLSFSSTMVHSVTSIQFDPFSFTLVHSVHLRMIKNKLRLKLYILNPNLLRKNERNPNEVSLLIFSKAR